MTLSLFDNGLTSVSGSKLIPKENAGALFALVGDVTVEDGGGDAEEALAAVRATAEFAETEARLVGRPPAAEDDDAASGGIVATEARLGLRESGGVALVVVGVVFMAATEALLGFVLLLVALLLLLSFGAVETEALLFEPLPGELNGFFSGAEDRLRNLLDDVTVVVAVVVFLLLAPWSLLLWDVVVAGGGDSGCDDFASSSSTTSIGGAGNA